MALYHYQAIDTQGKKRKGVVEAHNDREAKARLREQGLMVASLGSKSGAKGKENLQGEQLINFTLQFSQLVNAGIPVYESLAALEEQHRDEPYHQVLASLCDQIKAGKSLSETMKRFPNSFDRLYCAMIAAGESVGALDQVLTKLGEFLAKQNKMKKEIATAMIYPSVLAGFALLVISLLLGFVVPSIEGIFAERKLNSFTQIVISISHFFRGYWWLYLPLAALLIGGILYRMRSLEGKKQWERFLLRLPLTKTLLIQAAIARFCRTMGTLLTGGMPLIESLRISREVMQNYTLEKEIARAEEKIMEGSSLSRELDRSRWVPKMVSRMLGVAEETGSSVVMMNKIAEIYEQDLEKTLARLMALAQPVILIFMGVVIGTVLLAILLPLTDMSSFSL